MAHVVTINRPDVAALIEEAARKLTGGNRIAAVGLALRRLLDEDRREGSLFGAHRGSVHIRDGVDLIAPALIGRRERLSLTNCNAGTICALGAGRRGRTGQRSESWGNIIFFNRYANQKLPASVLYAPFWRPGSVHDLAICYQKVSPMLPLRRTRR